ncbi:MAG: RCC1 repeat-containing protein [Thermoanaerobaculia bacterium]
MKKNVLFLLMALFFSKLIFSQLSTEIPFSWGNNDYGQLGNGTSVWTAEPVEIPSLKDVLSISSGKIALKSDGTVLLWGKGECVPSPMPDLYDVVQVSAGEEHFLVLKKDGTVWAWGKNVYGQMGNGTWQESDVPVKVKNLENIIAISAGAYHCLALREDGTVWAWGSNSKGQLGNGEKGDLTEKNIPVRVSYLNDIIAISAGPENSYALKSDRTVWAWGYNEYGQLGNGTYFDSSIPVKVKNLQNVKQISVNIALKFDGTVWQWGNKKNLPEKVQNLEGIISISSSYWHFLALKYDGTVWEWNYYYSSVPKQVMNLKDVKIISDSRYSFFAVKKDGTVWGWGSNRDCSLLSDYYYHRHSPTPSTNIEDVYLISAGFTHSLALKYDGTVWTWGNRRCVPYSEGEISFVLNKPTRIESISDVISISAGENFSLFLKRDGTVWACGSNEYGQLGNGTFYGCIEPVQVLNLSNIIAISTKAKHCLALRKDGTVWAWGLNSAGQLGIENFENSNLPIKVPDLENVIYISTGRYHSLALKNDGSVWAWGWNREGQLGTGDWENRNTPVQVINLNNIVFVDAGACHSLAIKADGTLWVWGSNELGQLGIDELTWSYNEPVKLPYLEKIISASGGWDHSLALTEDGYVWAWGYNKYGQLGDNTKLSSRKPVKVLNISNVRSISAGHQFSLAIAPAKFNFKN